MSELREGFSTSEDGALFRLCHFRTALPDGSQSANLVVGLAIGPLVIGEVQGGGWRITHLPTGRAVAQFRFWDDAALAAPKIARLDLGAVDSEEQIAREALRLQISEICREVMVHSEFQMVRPGDDAVTS